MRTAASLAAFNGGTLLFSALVMLPASAFGFGSLWLVLLLAGFGSAELYGRGLMRRYEVRAARFLAGNQLLLLVVVWLYCAFSARQAMSAELPFAGALSGSDLRDLMQVMAPGAQLDVDAQVQDAAEMYRSGLVSFYIVVALVAGLVQGLCAYYYFTRGAVLRALSDTPEWVREVIGPA